MLYRFTAGVLGCFILCASTGKEPASALHLLSQMKALGVDPDRISYTSVIAAVRNKPPIDWLLIEELLTEMAHRGITLDMVTANAAITAYLRAEQWSRVVSEHGRVGFEMDLPRE